MTSNPLTSFIPTSWSQQKKTTSIHSQSSSINTVQSPPWSAMSLDQFSFYARKASNSSLSLLTNNSSNDKEDKKKLKQIEKIQSTTQGFIQVFLMSLNDCSLGYYRVSDHIHRKVPRIVETKKQLKQQTKKVDTAISDIEDVRKSLAELERLESFYNINTMIQQSIKYLK